MRFLLLIPPLTQLNTPYPSTTVLKGFLEFHGHHADQGDLGIELVAQIYTKDFLSRIFPHPDEWQQQAIHCVEPVMRFLRGEDNTLAPRIANRSLLPEGPRFNNLADMEWAYGTSGTEDKARYLATLFIEDIADHIRQYVDPHFDLIRYAETIANFAPTFDEIEQTLQAPLTIIDELMLKLLEQHIQASKPETVCLSIPFPGCLYGALRCGQYIKKNYPDIRINLGGGFPNTEWRQLSDARIFDYCHTISIDDGEEPLLSLAEQRPLVRTFIRNDEGMVEFINHSTTPLINNTTPSFEGLPLHLYFSMAEMTNPMHRLWSQGRWNKLMMAHGCYWHKCAFCDTSLDYIGRYCAPTATQVVDHMERIAAQTGNTGFHFVDEALPPKLLEEVSQEILRRGDVFSWWGNIRFEKAYTQTLCDLMADAGCIAVSGGLEVASDRLLKLMNKGVTIEQTVNACRHFRNSGIMVHTYLMYGFPTESLQESVNALEVVRRMFEEGIVQSAFWHRYAMTCHSPSGLNPENYGARRTSTTPHPFCNNEVDWEPLSENKENLITDGNSSQFDYDIDAVGDALRFATYNYMNEVGLDLPLHRWFAIKVPKPTVKRQ